MVHHTAAAFLQHLRTRCKMRDGWWWITLRLTSRSVVLGEGSLYGMKQHQQKFLHLSDVEPSSPSRAYCVARTAVNNLLPRPLLMTSNCRPSSAAAAAESKISVGPCSNRRSRPSCGAVYVSYLITRWKCYSLTRPECWRYSVVCPQSKQTQTGILCKVLRSNTGMPCKYSGLQY